MDLWGLWGGGGGGGGGGGEGLRTHPSHPASLPAWIVEACTRKARALVFSLHALRAWNYPRICFQFLY